MGLVEGAKQIEFLGREFAMWLYWHSNTNNGKIKLKGVEEFELWFDSPVQVAADYGDATCVTLKGNAPLDSPEARRAFLEGKKIDRARVRINYRNQTYTFGFNAATLAISGLKCPAPQAGNPADFTMMRLEVFEEFQGFFDSLIDIFLGLRLDEKAWRTERGHMLDWVKGFGQA